MSKINRIQQALLEIGGGEFQKLGDAYLSEKGYGQINSIGSVVGANKAKRGTPDTLVTLPNGNYIFVQHTTQEGGLFGKLKTDLEDCFDEDKAGIPVEKVERVIFCFTSQLNGKQQEELAKVCQKREVNLDLFGIDAISYDLYRHYPGLARDFLGIEIDTGQIVSLDQFVSRYNNKKLATRLDLDFHFRDEELGQMLDALESDKLVFLSGRAGIGKSRLALEACERFVKVHPEYEAMCIFGRNRDLWEDLQTWFSRPGSFLILVDDANRVSKFEYVVDLLQRQRENQQIKVVATVRDYALSKVRDAAQTLDSGAEVELEPFTEEEIRKLITDEYNIVNGHYLERITDVARGNPRLAVMAAEVAIKGSLGSIYDVSALYDHYFFSIREDLKGEGVKLDSSDLLKVAAIVSFFKAVDRTNEQMMNDVEEAFNITPVNFWKMANRLHELEMLDMHENEVVRVSDQVLGTYLFYLAVFKVAVLDFGLFLDHFFPKLQHRLIAAINPTLSAFDSQLILDSMRPHVKRAWSSLENQGNDEGLLRLIDVFWFTKPTDTLVWARECIEQLEAEPVHVNDVTFEKDSNAVPSPSTLSVLRHFAHAEEDERRIALDLMWEYLSKRPSEVPLLLRVLTEDYGFKPNSYSRGFKVQHVVVDKLWERAKNRDPLFPRLFLAVAENHLETHFENYEMKDAERLQIYRFNLPVTPELVSLRETIWQRLFDLYEDESFQGNVLELIKRYSMLRPKATNRKKLVKGDARHVLPFLESRLEPENYQHCVVLHDYLDLLERLELEIPISLREHFYNDTYAIAELILPKGGERQKLGLSHEEYQRYKQGRIDEHMANFTLEDYACFFNQCQVIREELDEQGNNEYRFRSGVVTVLLALATRDPDLYRQVAKLYLNLNDPFQLRGYALVRKLVEQLGYDSALHLLSASDYSTKTRWLFHFHRALPEEDIDEERLNHLYNLYVAAERVDLPSEWDFLLKYLPLDSRVVAKVVTMVLDKLDSTSALSMLFNPHTEVAKRLPDLFAEDINLLKRAYFIVEGSRHQSDYKGDVLNRLLDLDPGFIMEYIDWKCRSVGSGRLSSHDDNKIYTFIWSRPDHQEVMDGVVDSIYNHEHNSFVSLDPYLQKFFHTQGDDGKPDDKIRKRQDTFLKHLIDDRNEDVPFMAFLFGTIAQLLPKRRYVFVEYYLQKNKSFEAFKRLPLEPAAWSSNGSWISVLQERLNYWELILPLMNTVELIHHKQYVERNIQGLHSEIEREKKKDFIAD